MKRLGIGCLVLGIAVLAGADRIWAEEENTGNENPTRAVCFLPLEGDISSDLLLGMQERAEQADDLEFSWYYYTDFASMDFEVYADMAIAMQEDYLISFGGTAEGEYEEAVTRLKDAGVQLIVVDHDMADPADRTAFVGTDNRAAGAQILEYVEDAVEEPVAAVFMTYSHGGILERSEAMKESSEKNEIQLAATVVLPENAVLARQEIEELLEKEPQINVVIGLDGTSSIAVAQVMEDRNEDLPYTVCFDCEDAVVSALKNQKIDLIMMQDYGEMGRACIDIAASREESEEGIEVYTKCIPVTRETIDEVYSG